MSIQLSSLRTQALPELVHEAQENGIDNAGNLQPSELIFELVRLHSSKTDAIIGDGFLEVLPDGFGFLRSSISHFAPGVDDIYVSPSQIRRFNLRSGDWVEGKIRVPREGERYLALLQIHSVNGLKPDKARHRLRFSSLQTAQKASAIPWSTDFGLSISEAANFGYGDNILIRTGRSSEQHDIIQNFMPLLEAIPVIVLIGAAPMQIEEYQKDYKGELFCSRAGSPADRNVQAAEFALLRAKRIAEQHNNVVLFISSIDRLLRSYRDVAELNGSDGSLAYASIGIRRIMGQSQALKKGGSITTIGFTHGLNHPIDQRLNEDLAVSNVRHLVIDTTEGISIDVESSLALNK